MLFWNSAITNKIYISNALLMYEMAATQAIPLVEREFNLASLA